MVLTGEVAELGAADYNAVILFLLFMFFICFVLFFVCLLACFSVCVSFAPLLTDSAASDGPLIIYYSSDRATKTEQPLPLTFLLRFRVFQLPHCLFPRYFTYGAELQHLSEDSSQSATYLGL